LALATLSHPEIVSCASLAAVIDPVALAMEGKIWKKMGEICPMEEQIKMPLYYQLAENTNKR
jgi:hypothetical protein